jgi:hypothetical protein
MKTDVHPEARDELRALGKQDVTEYAAMLHAIAKLEAVGPALPYPHTSHVQGSRLRELRPRRGRSPWRAFYTRVGDVMLIVAIGPEAQHDPRGFDAAVARANTRLGS